MNEHAVPSRDTITLDRVKFASRRHVSSEFLNGVTVDVFDGLLEGLTVELQKQVLTEKLPPASVTAHKRVEFTFQMPASWWQMWKFEYAYRWHTRWIVKRWPVRFQRDEQVKAVEVTVNLQLYRTYPEATYAIPNLGASVKFHTLNVESRIL